MSPSVLTLLALALLVSGEQKEKRNKHHDGGGRDPANEVSQGIPFLLAFGGGPALQGLTNQQDGGGCVQQQKGDAVIGAAHQQAEDDAYAGRDLDRRVADAEAG